MSDTANQIVRMLEILPDSEQVFALEFIKRLVLAWDPDYTKLTRGELSALEAAENGAYIDINDINWDEPDDLTDNGESTMNRKMA